MIDRAEAILKGLGKKLLEWRALGETDGQWVGTQLKAEADRRAHRFLLDALHDSWPGIPVISEEDSFGHDGERPETYWLIDPIDGTASFCGGFSGFVTQMALLRDGKPVLGIVHAPALELTWRAEAGKASTRNGVPIHVASVGMEKTLIDNYPEPRGIARVLFDELKFSRYVECGSIGLKLCRVADGTAHVFVKDVVVRDWDLAPAEIILANAGGQVTVFSGQRVQYAGDMEKVGIIATASAELAGEVHAWKALGGWPRKPG